jgi:hypothetical protein
MGVTRGNFPRETDPRGLGSTFYLAGMVFAGRTLYTVDMRFFSSTSVDVYELVNERLREIYVGRTSGIVFSDGDKGRPSPAWRIAHWKAEDVRPPRSIEADLDEEDAERFIQAYVLTPLPKGWRFVT